MFSNIFGNLGSFLVRKTILDNAQREKQARQNLMERAWQAYKGYLPQPLRVRMNQPNDNVLMNYPRLIVDKGVSFLFGKGVEFTVQKPESERDMWLERCWQASKKMQTLHRLGVNGGVCGDAYIKIVIEPESPFPRLVVLEPSTVDLLWDPEDCEKIVEYQISWNAIDPERSRDGLAQTMAMRQIISPDGAGWMMRDQVSRGSGQWVTTQETAWPYTFAPVFHSQNLPCPNEVYGQPDLPKDLIDLVNSQNFVASNICRILRYHATPKTVGFGFTAQQLKVGTDDLIILPNEKASLKNLEMQSDLASSLNYLQYLDEKILNLAEIPPIALGRLDSAGPISGIALRLHFQPLIERTQTKQMLYGDMLTALNQALLELGGFGANQLCGITWPDLLPAHMLEEAQTALLLEQLGVSRDTILQRLGFDAEEEQEKRAEEDKARLATAQTAFNRGNVDGNPYPTGDNNGTNPDAQ